MKNYFNDYKFFAITLISVLSLGLVAQESDESAEDLDEEEVLEEVITTGSRIARSPLEMSQPVTVISGDEYRKRAYVNAAQGLTALPEVGAVNTLSGDQAGLGAGQQVAANFGLGSSRTVVLVNGRRFEIGRAHV